MNHPHGAMNSVCLPNQDKRTRMTYAVANMNGKSQLDVWGAAISTNLLWADASPSTRQPNSQSHDLPIQYESNPKTA